MKTYLFVGGPLHGQTRAVQDDQTIIRVPVLGDAARDESGVPILGQTVNYVRRSLEAQQNSTGQRFRREMFVPSDMPAQMASILLGELLTMLWILDAPVEEEPVGAAAG